MSNIKEIYNTHKQLAEMMIKNHDIHEGYWGIVVRFGFTAAMFEANNEMTIGAIVPIDGIGIREFERPNPLTVDASVVNPSLKKKRKPKVKKKAVAKKKASLKKKAPSKSRRVKR